MDQTPDEPKSRWKWLVIVPVILLVGVLGYRWAFPAYTPPVQPEPNAYDELVGLGEKVARRTGFYDEMSDGELASIVAINEPVLVNAREALRKEVVVSLDWQADEKWLGDVHMDRSAKLRELARAFAAEGRHAQLQGDTRRAVACGLEALQLVPAASRGGLGIDYLLGLGIGYGSTQWLREACETATLEDCEYVLANLPSLRKQIEPPANITEREWHFFRRVNGLYNTFIMEMTFANNRAEFEKRLQDSLFLNDARLEIVRLHYAIRAFRLRENRLPKSIDELAEHDLKVIPKDSFSGADFVYQPGKNKYLLFSVGPNGVDDGGVSDEKNDQKADLFVEPRKSLGTETVPAND